MSTPSNMKPSEAIRTLAEIHPQDTSTTVTSGWAKVDDVYRVLANFQFGQLEDTAKVYLLKGTDSGNGGTTGVVASASVTTSQTARVALINGAIDQDYSTANNYAAIRVKCAAGTNNTVSGVLQGHAPRTLPGSNGDASEVVSITN